MGGTSREEEAVQCYRQGHSVAIQMRGGGVYHILGSGGIGLQVPDLKVAIYAYFDQYYTFGDTSTLFSLNNQKKGLFYVNIFKLKKN